MRHRASCSVRSFGRSQRQGICLLLLAAAVIAASGRGATGQTPGSSGAASLRDTFPSKTWRYTWNSRASTPTPSAWHKSAAYKLLNDTSLGTLLEDLAKQVIDQAQVSNPEEKRVSSASYLNLLKHAVRNGWTLGVFGKGPDKHHPVIVLRKASGPEFARLMKVFSSNPPDQPEPQPIQKNGRAIHSLGPELVWWIDKDDMIVTHKDAVDDVAAVVDGKQPSRLTHPLRSALIEPKDGFEPAACGFVDLGALPQLPENPKKAGLDGVKRIELRWGFQDEALMTQIRVVAPSPRRGVLGFFDQPTFDLRSLPPLPAGHPAFAVLSVDLARTYDRYVALYKAMDPGGEQAVGTLENTVRAQFGLDLRNDLLKHLGPKLCIYSQPTAAPPVGNPMAAMMGVYAGVTLTFQVRDEPALAKQLDVLIKAINPVLGLRPQAAGADPPQFRKKNGPHTEYVLEFPPGSVPDGPLGMLSPTLALNKDQLIVAATSAAAEQALALTVDPADKRWTSTAADTRAAERIPHNLIMLIVTDPRDMMPAMIANLPFIAQALNAQMAQRQAPARRARHSSFRSIRISSPGPINYGPCYSPPRRR